MTNYDKWARFTSNATSPQSWIDFGFYFLIGAALQRRVWLFGEGDDGGELYPNLYMVFVGRPGLGKGLITRPIARMMRHHKLENAVPLKTNIGTERPSLFPMGADSQTFEELMDDLAESIRRVLKPDGRQYIHTSFCYVLEELDSLFKRKTQDVCSFLKNAYDCGPYEYKTKHQGKFILRALCLSLLAGTQPDFFKDAQKTGLFGEGFFGRTLWIFEEQQRFSRFHNTTLDDEQKECEKELLSWIKRLSLVYGAVSYSEETASFLEDWIQVHDRRALTAHPRMREYLGRKKVIMLKLALAIHFSEEISFTLSLDTIKKALTMLEQIEPNLEAGLGCTGTNPMSAYFTRFIGLVHAKVNVSEREFIVAFINDLDMEEIRNILATLVTTRQLRILTVSKGQNIYALP